jgi:hypothetical protein
MARTHTHTHTRARARARTHARTHAHTRVESYSPEQRLPSAGSVVVSGGTREADSDPATLLGGPGFECRSVHQLFGLRFSLFSSVLPVFPRFYYIAPF